MWIRSQDLYTLIKCERLSVRQCASKTGIRVYTMPDDEDVEV